MAIIDGIRWEQSMVWLGENVLGFKIKDSVLW